jgi:hypothetical protein
MTRRRLNRIPGLNNGGAAVDRERHWENCTDFAQSFSIAENLVTKLLSLSNRAVHSARQSIMGPVCAGSDVTRRKFNQDGVCSNDQSGRAPDSTEFVSAAVRGRFSHSAKNQTVIQ